MLTDRTILQTTNLSIGYRRRGQGDRVVAAGLDLSLAAGRLVCLLGPNGVGKSTLMRTLAGMQPALAGQWFVRIRAERSCSAFGRSKPRRWGGERFRRDGGTRL